MEKESQFHRNFLKGVMLASCFSFVLFAQGKVYALEYSNYTEETAIYENTRAAEEAALYAKEVRQRNIQRELASTKRQKLEKSVLSAPYYELMATVVRSSKALSNNVEEMEALNFSLTDVLENSVVTISAEEYYDLCRMTFAESGHCSWEMQNACASAAIHQMQQESVSMNDILYSGRFGDGEFKFTDYTEDGRRIRRSVEVSDLTASVYDAVNAALMGYDVTYDAIGGAIGFYAPNYCSDETNAYFNEHISGTTMIENVVFFHEWID